MSTHYQKPTILQVLPELKSGGVERGAIEISSYIKRNGFNSIVASYGGPMVSGLYAAGVKHIDLPLHSKNPLTIYKNIRELEKIITYYEVDIIHARSRAPAWSAYFAAKRTGINYVTTFHGIYKFSTFLKKLYNSIMTKGVRVIATSNFTKDHILSNYDVIESNVETIHRGVDLSYFDVDNIAYNRISRAISKYNIPADKTVILLPARMTRWKGHKFLIDALKNIDKDKYYCVMVGEESNHEQYVKELRDYISSLKLTNNIIIQKPTSDMPALYYAADVIISASIEPESFGRVAVEAQAMGKILIATSIGGSLETVIDGKTGFLVEPNNVEQLTEKLKMVMSLGEEQVQKISKDAMAHIRENFSSDIMCHKTVDLYNKVIAEGKSAKATNISIHNN